MNLNTPIEELNKVGKSTASRLRRLGLNTVRDLLYYFPFRYEDFRRIVPIKELQDGEAITVKAKLELISNKRGWKSRKMITEALVSDDTGSLRVVWFNQPFVIKLLHPGETIFLSGVIKTDMLGAQMISPVYEKVDKVASTHTARLVPIYPLTNGLTQKQIRFLISQIINLADQFKEWLPEEILEKFDLVPLSSSLHGIHFSEDEKDLKSSLDRLKFDELFVLQLKAARARLHKESIKAPKLVFPEAQIKDFVSSLPFNLTKTQKVSAWEILQDLDRETPMNRLLSGDVGSGKTVVAAMAMYSTVLNGYQAVLLAPTEILARQHFDSLVKLFGDKLKIGLISKNFRELNYESGIKNHIKMNKSNNSLFVIHNSNIIVGTHALLSEKIEFSAKDGSALGGTNLGFVVVDEQHRFGVGQRKEIKNKGLGVHFLSMTATPIPRSLALTLYGDLDVSIINELPVGRKPIMTRLVEPHNRQKAYEFIHRQVKQGRQVFVVCPLIDEGKRSEEKGTSENVELNKNNNYSLLLTPYSLDKKSVMSEYEKLSKEIFPDLRVGYLHGKLPAQGGSAAGGKISKESVMKAFKDGEIDILVSTSVVEVGVDVPNASVMMIEGSERFGLAQLHQFRGRVGRSIHQSYCFLFIGVESARAMDRLKYFEKNLDGFKLAEKDLEMRGPGEAYGVEQSGMANLRLAKLTDREIIKKAREAAQLVAPDLEKYPRLLEKFKEWEENVHLE